MTWKMFFGIANIRDRSLAIFGALMVSVLVSGCVSSSAPRGWLPSARESKTEPFGSWIEIHIREQNRSDKLEGEFIAVSKDSVFYADERGLHSVPREAIRRARIASYQSSYGSLAAWTVLGSLSTATHGLVLVASFPFWVLFGSITTAARSHEGMEWAKDDWESHSKFARYPNGIPSELDRSKIRCKR